VVNDISMSPTYSRDAANGLAALLRNRATGLFHMANTGACTWYALAKAISEFADLGNAIHPVSSSEFGLRAARPKNSALITEQTGFQLPPWKDALKAYLVEKGHLRYFS
jgi:dTDP-4-dehydrorhamnose reductase